MSRPVNSSNARGAASGVIQARVVGGIQVLQARLATLTAARRNAAPAAAQRKAAPGAPQPVAGRAQTIQRHSSTGVEAFRVPLQPKSGGQQLPSEVRAKMETAFGADFSDVRVHVGHEAQRIGAIAYTWGSNIHFAPGHYNPHTLQGQKVLGHELWHVVQQKAGRVKNPFGSGVAVVQDNALEAEADRMGIKAALTSVPPARAVGGRTGPAGGTAHCGPGGCGHVQPKSATVQRIEIDYTDSTGTARKLEVDTADLPTLMKVDIKNIPLLAHKRAYSERRQKLERKGRVAVVMYHHARVKRIYQQMFAQAPVNLQGAVKLELKKSAAKVKKCFDIWLDKARSGSKDFSELNLVKAIKVEMADVHTYAKLNQLEAKPSDTWVKGIQKSRRMVGDALSLAEAGVKAAIIGASIKYRGSLATQWRNAKKSTGGVANRMDTSKYDADAFVEVGDAFWHGWADLEIVTERERDGKMGVSELITRTKAMLKSVTKALSDIDFDLQTIAILSKYARQDMDVQKRQLLEAKRPGYEAKKPKLERALSQLTQVQGVEKKLQLALKSIPGYKTDMNGMADFEFVMQPECKSKREMTSGNLYPLEEIERAGLAATEIGLELRYEDGKIMVRMPERHISMTKPVTDSTYPNQPADAPHTQARPTPAMAIKQLFGTDNPDLGVAVLMEQMKERRLQREYDEVWTMYGNMFK